MPQFKYRALQVITDDSGEWRITDEVIRAEYEIEAQSSKEAMEIGNEKLFNEHPEVPLKSFITGVS